MNAFGAVHGAIRQLRRVEDRLLALLVEFADRWGRVSPDGIIVSLPLTHSALGRLVGAERPTVSLAIAQLSEPGLVDRRNDGSWFLHSIGLTRLLPESRSPGPKRSRSMGGIGSV